jgi:hypothetical protein
VDNELQRVVVQICGIISDTGGDQPWTMDDGRVEWEGTLTISGERCEEGRRVALARFGSPIVSSSSPASQHHRFNYGIKLHTAVQFG